MQLCFSGARPLHRILHRRPALSRTRRPERTVCVCRRSAMFLAIPQYLVVGVGGVAGALVAALILFQEKLLYHPTMPEREYPSNPAAAAMPYEDAEIVAEDGTKLHAWLIKQPASRSAATFVYFHGNAGNIGHRLPDARLVFERGYNLLMVSYRGYGASTGTPTERGLRQDADAAVAYAADRSDVLDTSRIYLFGRSIGGAVAISAAVGPHAEKIRGLVIENSFTSINDMIDVVMPFLGPAKWLNRNKWDSLERIKDVKVPMLFISGLRDELCPPDHMTQLYEAATQCEVREMHTVANGTHNDTWVHGRRAYREAIDDFVKQVER